MKLNVSYPANGSQKLIEVESDRKLSVFMDKKMGQEVPADSLGDEWKGYVRRDTSHCRPTIADDVDRSSASLVVTTSRVSQ